MKRIWKNTLLSLGSVGAVVAPVVAVVSCGDNAPAPQSTITMYGTNGKAIGKMKVAANGEDYTIYVYKTAAKGTIGGDKKTWTFGFDYIVLQDI